LTRALTDALAGA